jgi:hypothetical protein
MVVLVATGCAGWSSSAASSAAPPPPTSTVRPPAAMGMVRVPKEGNSWIGAIVPRLYRAGLRIAIPTAWSTSSYDGLAALIEHPASGTRLPRGSVVTLRVTGILGSPGWAPGNFVVPGVVDATLATATRLIEQAGLPWTVRATALPPTATDDLYASYCVTAQSPAAGTEQEVEASGPGATWGVTLSAHPC